MINKIKSPRASKQIIFLSLLMIFIGSFLILTLSSQATTFADINENIETQAQASGLDTSSDYTVVIGRIIQTALGVVGGLFVALFAYGGFLWMTAETGAGKNQLDKAKKVFTMAIIGLIIIVAAYAITSFVVTTVEKAGNQDSAPITLLIK